MTQLTTLVLKDHAAANVSFAPRDIVNGVATAQNSSGVPVGDKTVSWSTTRTTNGRRKAILKMVFPVVQDQVISGISKPTVVRTAYCDVTFSFDGTSTTVERQDMIAALAAALADSGQIVPLIQDLSAPY